ncbi:gamma-interferon-responsive lysosomal thiol protein-like isoform X2 [Brassica napus]|uniref:gamma-interferon-responsive lysosomal thiol protein-like isoform X2 n=1 Tax=Brassica napus TaxID=3708 RepID=UPI00207A7FA8|nr:gamma-interferon-responsive lysosomal thiol protein-like isoform X2 [Brassica napus]
MRATQFKHFFGINVILRMLFTMTSSSSHRLVFFCLACLLFTFSYNFVAGESDKVKLNLYYESLCPYCQSFIADGLVKIFDSDLHTITDLKLVPFGNAHVSDKLTVTCQHGEEECKLNAIEACAIRTWPDPNVHYWFIRCIENDTTNWESSCFTKYGGKKAIKDCYTSDLSKTLILGYANQTLSLKPKHIYVPWVTVNGKPQYEVCKAYKGKASLQKICHSSALSKSPQSKVVKLQVSYADEVFNHQAKNLN